MKKTDENLNINASNVGKHRRIPLRYAVALSVAVSEIALIIGAVVILCREIPLFNALYLITNLICIVKIIASDDNPDYKAPWLICVIALPIVGFVLYVMFYSRKLEGRYIKRIKSVRAQKYAYDDSYARERLASEDKVAASQAKMLCEISRSHLFLNTDVRYFPSGRATWESLIDDLWRAEKFIFIEFFIIDSGVFWSSVLEVLRRKAALGVDVRVIYDDVGCMTTLPGNYDRILRSYGINTVIFSKLCGNADSKFNNRSHRKIVVIDGKVGYTGGINIADEYVGERVKFGHWKDAGVRIEGDAVREMTWLFLFDFGINSKTLQEPPADAYPSLNSTQTDGYVIPFGDGPKPIYSRGVAKSAIQNMVCAATEYVYVTTPYLIMDNDLCSDIERAALRGVDVRIVVPHVPDKRIVFAMTRSFYHRLMDAGVKIYEYEPGFIHAKTYVADGKYAIVGTSNLDYRSLVHNFENGVWMYGNKAVRNVKEDVDEVIGKSLLITEDMLKTGALRRFVRALIRIFAPMM